MIGIIAFACFAAVNLTILWLSRRFHWRGNVAGDMLAADMLIMGIMGLLKLYA